jgi:choice-of-anchor C domain-containing protein
VRLCANLVIDGSFEAPIAASPFQTFGAGSSVGGWTVTSGSIDLINGYWNAADGNQSIDLSGNSRGTIQQTINASAGSYQLTFALSGNSDGPPTVKTVLVSFGGLSTQFSFTTPANNNNNMSWTTETWDFSLPAGGNNVLSFQDISDGQSAYGAALDNIILTQTQAGETIPAPVPEAGTLLAGMLLLFPLGLSAIRIFRRNYQVIDMSQSRLSMSHQGIDLEPCKSND